MTLGTWNAGAAAVAASLAIALVAGCGKDKESQPSTTSAPTRAEVFAAVAASTSVDTDGDGLPDDVENRFRALLGTDPTKADTDGDGVNDCAEVFGAAWLYVQSRGQAGALDRNAAATTAADGALPHEVDGVDSDGDGVPDYLEFAGYRFDWGQSRFVLDPQGFRTDPMQYSTDQDAYSDGMEASGLNMDVAVREPGNHPLVPAYPDVSVELTGYTVTLNTDVTTSSGGGLEQGTTWNREVQKTHSQAFEAGIEISPSAEFSLNPLKLVSFSVQTTYKFSSTTTDTTASTVAAGGNTSRTVNWNEARTTNPTEAAQLKLYLRVRNAGSAPATNVVPTLSLRIGGADVATFEPPDLSVAMLLPGGIFPPDEGVSWVVDQVGPGRPLMLTDWELRALESGAPVTIAVAQKRADVMRLDEKGAWARVGDVNDYVARILSSSADLFADVGAGPDGQEGQVIHARVASNDTPTAPAVTLGDALAWSMGFRRDDDGGYSLELPLGNGAVERVALARAEMPDPEHPGSTILVDDGEFRWTVDPITLANNFPVPKPQLTIDDLLGMRLGPLSQVSLRAPRHVDEPGPAIHTAYAVNTADGYRVMVCVSDYDGVARVLFVDADGKATELANDGRGPWFFSLDLDPASAGTLTQATIRAESVRTHVVLDPSGGTTVEPLRAEVPLAVVYRPTPKPPEFSDARYDVATRVVYLKVRPGGNLAQDVVDWVKVFNDTPAGTFEYATLAPVANRFEDPHGYTVALPATTTPLSQLRLVAYTKGFLYRAVPLTSLVGIYASGSGALNSQFDFTATDWWYIGLVDLERNADTRYFAIEYTPYVGAGYLATWWKGQVAPSGNPNNWTVGMGLADLYLRDSQSTCTRFWIGLFRGGLRLATPGDAAYQAHDRASIALQAPGMAQGTLDNAGKEAVFDFNRDDVFLFKTSDWRYGKLIVRSKSVGSDWWTNWCGVNITYDYVIYDQQYAH
jgi:hypothetical protein